MAPVHHAMEAFRFLHVALERRQEDLRRVAEDDDAERDGKRPDIDLKGHCVPVPRLDVAEAVDEYDSIDEHMCHGAAETEPRHGLQGLEEGAGQQQAGTDHYPGTQVNRGVGEAAHHKVPTQQYVQDTRHEQLDHLGTVDHPTAYPRPPYLLSYGHVASADPDDPAAGVLLIQTGHEYLTSVHTDVGSDHHGKHRPVTPLQHRVRERHRKHTLKYSRGIKIGVLQNEAQIRQSNLFWQNPRIDIK